MQKRMTDLDHPLNSQTVDVVAMGALAQNQNSHKDNQMAYKAMYQGNSRPQKNLASNYLRGIDNKLRQQTNHGKVTGPGRVYAANSNPKA